MNHDEATSLQTLPVELLHDIQLLALSESLPFASRLLHNVYHSTSSVYRAKYIFFRLFDITSETEMYTRALRYPTCGREVFDLLRALILGRRGSQGGYGIGDRKDGKPKKRKRPGQFDIPRRLFKNLLERQTNPWTGDDQPLPFLRHIFDTFKDDETIQPDVNANNGYALTKAVHIQSIPLIQFLLENGADPEVKGSLAIMVAIRQKNLTLVKMLIERQGLAGSPAKSFGKKRKLEDRVKPDAKMLKVAVQCKAQAITEYLYQEKGVVPDMQTLQAMM
ncbi:hypothetical protein FA13DRAFT_1483810 [Coprinellus micaceus]|uniref:Ankyrin n=1 Tax=Coprinellus micaceus TaxID=71717 RepID=A0A4Y7TK12_COPMI|nr:hypothetical protein FA13DRAFT_1483810 [Coprinellus micaceus]